METIGSPLAWGGFLDLVLALLAVDLGVFHRKSHTVGMREAAIGFAVWVVLAALFAAVERFVYLKVGLSFVLIFVGCKMMFVEVYAIPIVASLAIIGGILAIAVVASLVRGSRDQEKASPG